MVEKIQSIATNGLNGASMMMKREHGLEIVKKKREGRRESKTKENERQHVVGNSAVGCRKECRWSNQFIPCLYSNAAWRAFFFGSLLLGTWSRTIILPNAIAYTLVHPFLHSINDV